MGLPRGLYRFSLGFDKALSRREDTIHQGWECCFCRLLQSVFVLRGFFWAVHEKGKKHHKKQGAISFKTFEGLPQTPNRRI